MSHETNLPLTLPAALRYQRMVWYCLLSSLLVIPAIAEKTGPTSHRPSSSMFFAIAVLSMVLAVTWSGLRTRYVLREGRRLVDDPNDPRALRRWQTGHLMTFAMSEVVMLYGLVLRYQGFSFAQVTVFYAAGLILMLFSAPRLPRLQS